MNSIRRSFQLLRASQQVFAINPSLAWYPLVALLTLLSIIFLVVAPLGAAAAFLLHTHPLDSRYGLIPIILLSFTIQLVNIFVNSAFYLAAEAALNGEKLPMKKAFAKAWTHRKRLAQWAIVGTVIGLILNFINERAGIFGKVVSFIGSIAWALAIVFIIPTLIYHELGPIEALKHSATLFKRTWGENAVASFSLGILYFLAIVVFLLIPIPILTTAVFAGNISEFTGIALGLGLVSLLFAACTYLSSLEIVFNAALYRYAETGDYVGPFAPDMIAGAYHQKNKKS